MKTSKKRNELFATCCMHRQLERAFNRFSAAVGKVCARRLRNRHDVIQLLRQLRHLPVIVIGPAHVNKLCGLILNCLYDFRVAMAGRADRNPCVAVEENVSINILHPNSVRPLGDEFEIRSRVSWIHVLSIGGDDLFGIWTGRSDFYFWSFWCDSG